MTKRIAFRLFALSAAIPAVAFAQPAPVKLQNAVGIERMVVAADGTQTVTWKTPSEVTIVPGDKMQATLSYQNASAEPVAGFNAAYPVPASVEFVAANEDWAEVSVDGGLTYGKLPALTVSATDAAGAKTTRPATPADVTNVRWVFAQPIPVGAKGVLGYRGVVK